MLKPATTTALLLLALLASCPHVYPTGGSPPGNAFAFKGVPNDVTIGNVMPKLPLRDRASFAQTSKDVNAALQSSVNVAKIADSVQGRLTKGYVDIKEVKKYELADPCAVAEDVARDLIVTLGTLPSAVPMPLNGEGNGYTLIKLVECHLKAVKAGGESPKVATVFKKIAPSPQAFFNELLAVALWIHKNKKDPSASYIPLVLAFLGPFFVELQKLAHPLDLPAHFEHKVYFIDVPTSELLENAPNWLLSRVKIAGVSPSLRLEPDTPFIYDTTTLAPPQDLAAPGGATTAPGGAATAPGGAAAAIPGPMKRMKKYVRKQMRRFWD